MKLGSNIKKAQSGEQVLPTAADIMSRMGEDVVDIESIDGMDVFTVQTPTECPYDFSDRPVVCQLALKFNWAYNQGGDTDKAFHEFYNYVITSTGRVLLELTPEDCFCVGMAYTLITFGIETVDGERKVKSVSSENAFYCLVKYLRGTNDKSVLPTLFSLLYGPTDLLGDVLTSCHVKQMMTAASCGAFLGKRYAFNSPEFRESAISYRLAVCKYILDQVYDWDRMRFTIHTGSTPTIFWPDDEQISRFYDEFVESQFIAMNYEIPGKKYFDGVFEECERLLREF